MAPRKSEHDAARLGCGNLDETSVLLQAKQRAIAMLDLLKERRRELAATGKSADGVAVFDRAIAAAERMLLELENVLAGGPPTAGGGQT